MNSEPSSREAFAIEYFKSLREEIHLRLQEHHRLWFYKILSCGVALSFALSTPGFGKFACVIAPFVAVIFDFLIINNLVLINALGQYIKIEIEEKHFQDGWETKSRERYLMGAKVSWIADWIVIIISTLLILAMSGYSASKLDLLLNNWFTITLYIIVIILAFLVVIIYPFRHMVSKGKNKISS